MRSFLYFLARLLGNANAMRRGPSAVVKRQLRKVTYRSVSRLINKILK